MSCLSKEGVCVLEYSPDCDNKSQASDPFAATLDEYKDFIKTKYEIISVYSNKDIQKIKKILIQNAN